MGVSQYPGDFKYSLVDNEDEASHFLTRVLFLNISMRYKISFTSLIVLTQYSYYFQVVVKLETAGGISMEMS